MTRPARIRPGRPVCFSGREAASLDPREVRRELRAGAQAELAVDLTEVVLDRLAAEHEIGLDLGVGAPARRQQRDAELVGRELVEAAPDGRRLARRRAGGAQLVASPARPVARAEALERREGAAQRLAGVG